MIKSQSQSQEKLGYAKSTVISAVLKAGIQQAIDLVNAGLRLGYVSSPKAVIKGVH